MLKWCLPVLLTLSDASLAAGNEDAIALKEQIIDARDLGEMDRADALAGQLLSQANAESRVELQADALYQQARNAMERNRYETAQALLNQSIQLYKNLNVRQKLGHAYRQLGLTYRYQADYPQALDYIYQAMQLFQELQIKTDISSAYNTIGVILEKMGQYEQAVEAHQRSLELKVELDDTSGIASGLYNLGDLRATMGDYDLALNYMQDALNLDRQSGYPKDIAYSELKAGYFLLKLNRLDESRPHIETALGLFQQIKTPRDSDWAITSLAELEMASGNLQRASELIDGVIQRGQEHHYNSLLVDAYQVSAEVAYRQQDYPRALEQIEAGIAQARDNQEPADEAKLQDIAVRVFQASGDVPSAFFALQSQKQLEDSLMNTTRLEAIARNQAQTEFVRRAHQIELLEKEKALQQATLDQQRLMRNTWLAGLISAGLLAFLLYNRLLQRRVNRQLTEQVALRTRQLEDKNQQLAAAFEEMESISLTDKLTGLHNRRFAEKHVESDLNYSSRPYQNWINGKGPKPTQADIVVFVLDMDNFKQVNDTCGHAAGDNVLVQLAQRMEKVFRHSDYLVRWGGEEFLAIARFVDRKDAPHLAQRLLDSISGEPFDLIAEHRETQTCSIGYACYPPDILEQNQCSFLTLVGLADNCLYAAKAAGKNTWRGVETATSTALNAATQSPARFDELVASKAILMRSPTCHSAQEYKQTSRPCP